MIKSLDEPIIKPADESADEQISKRIEAVIATITDDSLKTLITDLQKSRQDLAWENAKLRKTGRESVHKLNSHLQGVTAVLEILERQGREHSNIAENINLLKLAFSNIQESIKIFRSLLT